MKQKLCPFTRLAFCRDKHIIRDIVFTNAFLVIYKIYIPRHMIMAEYYGFMLVIRVSIHPSYVHTVLPSIFLFPGDSLSKFQWIFPKLGMCIDSMEI